jgi:23S rRNA (cytidine1920-2'-O)/16S rRNA (cytidine1409-2'-O)-methyltransferase
VLVLERTNARTLEPEHVGGLADLIVVDASFIGLAKLLPAIVRCMRDEGELVALVKPQFEVGRKEASRSKGVVRDPLVRATAIASVTEEIEKSGLHVLASCDCSIEGPKGNREAFVHARKLRRDNEVLVPFERPAD